jgi:hypothetical protein
MEKNTEFPYAGIIRIRFHGYDLSLKNQAPLIGMMMQIYNNDLSYSRINSEKVYL